MAEMRIAERWAGRQLRPMPKFVIFGQGRSGSTLLKELLNSSPHVHCDEEILGIPRDDPDRHVRQQRRRKLGFAYGYKVKIYQLVQDQGIDDVGGWLRAQHHAGWKIIALRRHNVVRQVVSNLEATRSGEFHRRREVGVRAPLVVDPDVILEYARLRAAYGEREDRALVGVPHVSVSYEDDLMAFDGQQRTLDRLLDWLSLPRAEAVVSLHRTNPGSLEQLIENHDDLRARLVGTPFAAMWD